MSLLSLILTIVIVGFVLWAINALIPMEPRIKMILNVIVAIVVVVWALQAIGLWDTLGGIHVGGRHHSALMVPPATMS